MDNTVTIVTAFLDIGRGEWAGDRNNFTLPSWFKRSNEVYFERFERLTKLKNPIVVFTENRFFEKIHSYREDIITISIDNLLASNKELIEKIKNIQNNPNFINHIKEPFCPEYWCPEYVVINFLKSHFISDAILFDTIKTKNSAWIDFGYARENTYCPIGMNWKFNTDDKINIFYINELNDEPLIETIRSGRVYFQGCHIVAPNEKWIILKNLMDENMNNLINSNLIDDDQTLLLMSYRSKPDLFKLNYIDTKNGSGDWFVIFKNFNHD